MAGAASTRLTLAQGTPTASPVAGGYAHPEALIDAASLQDRLDDPALVIVGFMPATEFEVARMPGSVQVDWPELEVIDTSDASIGAWRQMVGELLGALGIEPASSVVVYDNGTLFAARLWWILRYLGHEDVALLDGGLAAWQAVGGAVATDTAEPPAGVAPYQGVPSAEMLAQKDEVLGSLDDPEVVIVDARTPEEYAEGHIPGAENVNFPLNAAPEPPKLYKPAAELRTMYEGVGITPDRLIIPYCTSGVRSAVTAHTLHLLGYERVALYTGSWKEWSEDPDTPKTEGDQP
jgi:thiosulfate/3-mercaptopyruvate sulfurtransferase